MHEAKTHLSRIVARVAQGESVLIGKAGKPVAVLSPYAPAAARRKPGAFKGRIWMSEDFDAPDETLADEFESGPADGP